MNIFKVIVRLTKIFSHLSFNVGLRILINKVSFHLLKKPRSVLTLYSGNILKCSPEQRWKCSLALIIVRSWRSFH
jgi:hypothetical protein